MHMQEIRERESVHPTQTLTLSGPAFSRDIFSNPPIVCDPTAGGRDGICEEHPEERQASINCKANMVGTVVRPQPTRDRQGTRRDPRGMARGQDEKAAEPGHGPDRRSLLWITGCQPPGMAWG